MAVPKRKVSKSKKRSRQRSHKKAIPSTKPCPQCGAPQLPHRVCPSCGGYRGRQVVSISTSE